MQRTQTYTIDGKTYESPEAMPADVRRKWDALANLVATFTAEGAARGLTQTNLKLIQRVVSGPGESRAGSAVPAPDATSEPSARALLGDTGSARAMLGETAPGPYSAVSRMRVFAGSWSSTK